MRVALVYDRLNKMGGAEQVLVAFHELFPSADWYTSFYDPVATPFSKNWKVHSFKFLHHYHEWFPWLMPFIFEAYDFSGYDLVISIGSAESKGIITKPVTYHLHYCLTPTRYLYSHSQVYLTTKLYQFVATWLRKWDQVASTRPDEMIAISTQVKKRIKKYYNRDADIIFPPVNTERFYPSGISDHRITGIPNDYFLVVSRLVPYKNIDILVKAANLVQANLVIIGQGSEYAKLKSLAGQTVYLLGHVKDTDLPVYYRHCQAYLQANEEDFGISMCEAQAAGKPVIAYHSGGAADIVISPATGVLLKDGTIAEFAKTMSEFGTMSFAPADCMANAKRFDKHIWLKQMKERIDRLCQTAKM